jgi:hypothetical protein
MFVSCGWLKQSFPVITVPHGNNPTEISAQNSEMREKNKMAMKTEPQTS